MRIDIGIADPRLSGCIREPYLHSVMPQGEIFEILAIALGLGVLVGLQRERSQSELAGIRTYPLIAVLGTVSALLADVYGGWVMGTGVLAIAALIVIGNVVKIRTGSADPGMTSEAAMLLMYGVGAYLVTGHRGVAIALGGGVAVLLHAKEWSHAVARKIGDDDFTAVMQFALISLVVLPVLPNREFGPYLVLNPREIWLMIVLISGISLGGYAAYKALGDRAGTLIGGFLGGLISSTATTVSYARKARLSVSSSNLAAIVIMIASAVVFLRVFVEIAVVAPDMLRVAALPVCTMFLVLTGLSAIMWRGSEKQTSGLPTHGNPTNLRSAIVFGLLYAAVIFAVAAAKEHLGDSGLFGVAIISGLTDMDAITLSNAQLVRAGRLDADTAWRLILVAGLSNLGFKTGTVALLGGRTLLKRILVGYGVAFVVGLGLVVLG